MVNSTRLAIRPFTTLTRSALAKLKTLKLKTLLRKAAKRTVEATWALNCFPPHTNYIANAVCALA
jgi:hypothetical protein